MSVKLKPCPFCGAEVDDSVPYAAAIVHKPKCFFRKVPHGKRGVHGFGEHTPPEAIEAWNTRAADERDGLIRDMASELRDLNDGGISTDCMEYEQRIRDMGIDLEEGGA